MMCIARLRYGRETLREIRNQTCDFEFRDLSYSTTYQLDVTVFNGKFESSPTTEEVSTLYDEISISFIIITILVAVMFYITQIYRKRRQTRDDVKEDVKLETTAIYENDERQQRRN
ncbi:receptor-type tyrosine-protein phosphatase C-like isoform X2 [Channa argus]|uniref:receptor-type tyrosine-protein phosphatase C-like isoform X2 n=1 Tax=Channa argus TaxID=215402 RepID=UPI003521B47A